MAIFFVDSIHTFTHTFAHHPLMARPPIYKEARRINIVIEASLHAQGIEKAARHRLRGGFSEYVARLIVADRKRKGRALNASRPTALLRCA